MRRRFLGATRAIGLEPQLRSLQKAFQGPVERRNRRDDENLRVVLATALRRDSNCIDVGANVGQVIDVINKLAPLGQHIAVEPLPDLAEQLRRRHPALTVHCCALSDSSGVRTFFRAPGAPAQSGFRPPDSRDPSAATGLAVETRRLDDLIAPEQEIAFIKIDVEGAEEEVLRGALGTIRRCRPVVAFEHGASGVKNYGTSHRAVHELITEVGLSIFDMDGNGPFSPDAFDQVADPPGKHWNFLARPT